MGRLKPGATYIYEKANGITYARESGADPKTRFEVGRDYDPEMSTTLQKMKDDKLWGEIRREAETNPALQDALERVKLLYYLTKEQNGS